MSQNVIFFLDEGITVCEMFRMSEMEHTPTRLRGMYRVEGIAPVDGWSLFQSDEYDGDGFHYLSYAAARGDEVRQLDTSRFRFTPSQDRFAWLVRNGFPPRPTLGPWDDTDIEMRMAIPAVAA